MSVLVYTESESGTYKKIALELTSYAKGIADAASGSVTAVSIGGGNADQVPAGFPVVLVGVDDDFDLHFAVVTLGYTRGDHRAQEGAKY